MQELSLKSGGGRNFGRGRNLGRVRYNYRETTKIIFSPHQSHRGEFPQLWSALLPLSAPHHHHRRLPTPAEVK